MSHRFHLASVLKLAQPLVATAVIFLASGCLPAQLDKYRHPERLKADQAARQALPPQPLQMQGQPVAGPAPARASIYALDKQTYRFALREGEVWDALLTVLLHNYNLTVADRAGGILSTEWDTFFLAGAVYRNKLSLRLMRSGLAGADLTIHNNVERLRDASQAAGTVGAVWLPAADPGNEVVRIIQNIALVLNQPPPVLPPSGPVATLPPPEGAGLSR